MTKSTKCDILKSTARERKNLEKILEKSSEKGLTKRRKCGMIRNAARKLRKTLPKKISKSFEKDLTNEKRCGIMNELSDKNG